MFVEPVPDGMMVVEVEPAREGDLGCGGHAVVTAQRRLNDSFCRTRRNGSPATWTAIGFPLNLRQVIAYPWVSIAGLGAASRALSTEGREQP